MSPKRERFEEALSTLETRLRSGKAASARVLAQDLGCSKPTIYSRIAVLERRGKKVHKSWKRDGSPGPLALFFSMRALKGTVKA